MGKNEEDIRHEDDDEKPNVPQYYCDESPNGDGKTYEVGQTNHNHETFLGHKIMPCCWCKDNLDGRDVHVVDDEYYCNQCYYEKEKGYDRPQDRNHIDVITCKRCNQPFENAPYNVLPIGSDYYCRACYDLARKTPELACKTCSRPYDDSYMRESEGVYYCKYCYDSRYDNSNDSKPCYLCHKEFYNNGLINFNGKNYCRDCYERYRTEDDKKYDNQIEIRTIKLPLEENKELYLRGFVAKHSNESLTSFDKLFRLPKDELKNVRLIVAILKNKIIGIGGFLITGKFATESWIVVHTEHRKHNLGTLMLQMKMSIAKAEKLKAYNSVTATQNKSSLAMLKKAKFTEIEQFTGIRRSMIRLVHFLKSGVYSGVTLKKLNFAIGVELK